MADIEPQIDTEGLSAEQLQALNDPENIAILQSLRARQMPQQPDSTYADQVRLANEAAWRELETGPKRKEVLRYGLPIAAALATAGESIPIQMATGFLASGGGELGAQASEGQFKPREAIGAAVGGSVPVLGGAGGVTPTLAQRAGSVGLAGLGNLAEQSIRGSVQDTGDAAKAFALGSAPSTVMQVAGAGFGKIANALRGGLPAAEEIERIGPGVKPTIGQVIPRFAPVEQRIVRKEGTAPFMFREEQNKAIESAMRRLGANDVDSTQIARNLGEYLGVPEVTALANEAAKVNKAWDLVDSARSEAEKAFRTKAAQELTDSFQGIVRQGSLSGVGAFQPAAAGARWEQAANDALEAFRAHSKRLYGPSNKVADNPAFDTTDIADKALEVVARYPALASGEIASQFAPSLGRLRQIMDQKSPASLNQLRQIRETLYDIADTSGEAMGTRAQRDIRGVADSITSTINSQAKAVFGNDIGQSLLDANKFYAEFRPQFDYYGVKDAFKSSEKATGQMAVQGAQAVQAMGVDAPRVANFVNLLDSLEKVPGVSGVPKSSKLLGDVRDALVQAHVDPASGKIDFKGLENSLTGIEGKSPGSLAKIGLGNIDDIKAASAFAQGLPEAMSAKGIDTIRRLAQKEPRLVSLALETLQSLESVDATMARLTLDALKSPKAAAALQDIRAKYLEQMFLKADRDTKVPRFEAVQEFLSGDEGPKARTILGSTLFDALKNDVIPGYARIAKAAGAAANAAGTISGQAVEAPFRSAAQGKVLASIVDLIALGAYSTASKMLSTAAGASGMRSRAAFLSSLDKLASGAGSAAGRQIVRNAEKAQTEMEEQGRLNREMNRLREAGGP